ncbi:hypothetical protein Tco_0236275 [Tanacetum coccineum]
MYRSMIGSLMYLTSSRPDIMFAVCACARYQININVSHLHAVKWIFRYLKGQPKLGLWYPKDSSFDLVAYTDSDYAGASLDRKSTTGGKAKKSVRLIVGKLFEIELELMLVTQKQFWSTVKAKTINGEQQLHALVDGKKVIITESTVRRDLQLEDEEGVDCLPNATIFEHLALIGPKTTAWNEFSSTMAFAIICLATNQKFNFSKFIFESMIRNLENVSSKFLMYPRFVQVFLDKQLDGMSTHNGIYIAPSHTKKIFRNMRRVGKGFSGRVTPLFSSMVIQNQSELSEDEVVHKELGDNLMRAATIASSLKAEQDSGNITKTQSKATPNESSSLRLLQVVVPGDTLRSDEDGLKLDELMEFCTTLQKKVKKLEKKRSSRTHKLKRLYKVGLTARVESFEDEESVGEDASKQGRRINDIDEDKDITLVNVQDDADKEMSDVGTVTVDEVFTEKEVVAKDVNLIVDEVTLAQALAALKSVKPKVKGDVIEEPSVPVNVVSASTKVSAATTTTATIPTPRKGIVVTKLEIIRKISPTMMMKKAKRLQAEFDKEERLAREKDEANVALTKEWDDIQAKIKADHELA